MTAEPYWFSQTVGGCSNYETPGMSICDFCAKSVPAPIELKLAVRVGNLDTSWLAKQLTDKCIRYEVMARKL